MVEPTAVDSGDDESTTRVQVTLIHGTNAPRAPWTQPGSMLRDFLALRVPHIFFSTFDWSGRNSHKTRLDAAQRLRQQIVSQHSARPRDKRFIIAHSHGGNIALYAMRDPLVQSIVDGVFCLNTPFVVAMRRSIGGTLRGPGTLLVAVGLLLAYPLFQGIVSHEYGRTADAVAMVLVTLGGLALFLSILWIVERIHWRRRIKTRQWKILRNLGLPKISRTTVTCLWSAGDEIHDLFLFADTLTNLPYALLRFECLFAGFALAILGQFGSFYCGHLLLFPYYDFVPFVGPLIDDAAWLAKFNAAPTPLTTVLLLFVAIWFSSVLYIIALFVGLELFAVLANGVCGFLLPRVNSLNPFDAHYVRVSGTLTPTKGNMIHFQDFESELGRWRHSVIYDDQAVLRYIARLLSRSHQSNQE